MCTSDVRGNMSQVFSPLERRVKKWLTEKLAGSLGLGLNSRARDSDCGRVGHEPTGISSVVITRWRAPREGYSKRHCVGTHETVE